jgi:hypothetical protein
MRNLFSAMPADHEGTCMLHVWSHHLTPLLSDLFAGTSMLHVRSHDRTLYDEAEMTRHLHHPAAACVLLSVLHRLWRLRPIMV